MRRIRITSTITALLLFSLIILALANMIVQTQVRLKEFKTRTVNMRQDYISRQKNILKREVEWAVNIINYRRLNSVEEAEYMVRDQVTQAYVISETIYEKYSEIRNDNEIKQIILNALRPVGFNEGKGYYFIISQDGIGIMNGDNPELEGFSLLELQDINGKHIVRDMINIAEKDSEGFYQYRWTKPDSPGNDYQKISYIKLFGPYNWIIGSGVYVSDIENRNKIDLVKFLGRVEFGTDGYIFIGQWDGMSLSGPEAGKNMLNVEAMNDFPVVKELIAAAKSGGGYIQYNMPDVSEDRGRLKLSYTEPVEDWEWYVGAGLYIDHIELKIRDLEIDLREDLQLNIAVSLMLSLLVILIFMLAIYIINRNLMKDFYSFVDSVSEAASSGNRIVTENIRFHEAFSIAEGTNRILQDRIKIQNRLLEEKEQLSVTLSSIGEGVVTTDPDGRIVLMNNAAEKMTGWSESEIAGDILTDKIEILDKKSGSSMKRMVIRVLQMKTDIRQSGRVVLVSKSGQKYDIEVNSAPILDRENNLWGIVFVFSDITERLKNEDENLKLKKLESLGVLAGGIAHDFNNLLTGIFGNLELAKMIMNKEDKAYQFIEYAENSMENAINLTRQLLTFSWGGEPVKEVIRVGEALADTAEFSLRGSNIRLVTDIDPELWPVNADKGQLGQVISNLIINAKQAMPGGGIIRIRGNNIENDDGKFIHITVQDEGIGISDQYLEKIFDPYFTTKQSGSGLGLASTYSIIKKHDGKISVESEIGKGTSFYIFLPAVISELTDRVEKLSAADDKFETGSVNILVIDDEEAIRNVLGTFLEKLDCRSSFAAEGGAGIELYVTSMEEDDPFQVVITDLTIPGGMGGKELAEKLQVIDSKVKIIASSGYANDPILSNFKEYGFSGRLVKPYSFAEFRSEIMRVLDLPLIPDV